MQDVMLAIKAKDIAQVQELLPTALPTINQVGNRGYTLLDWAVSQDYEKHADGTQLVQLLLDNGATPNGLSNALRYHNLDIVQLLLEHGADPNAKVSQGMPLIATIFDPYSNPHDDPRKAKKAALLLKHGADPNVTFKLMGSQDAMSTLMLATRQKEWKSCVLLLDAGADPDFESTGREGSFRKMIDTRKTWGINDDHFRKILFHEAMIKGQ